MEALKLSSVLAVDIKNLLISRTTKRIKAFVVTFFSGSFVTTSLRGKEEEMMS